MPCFVAQGFFPPVHRAFTGAQSFFPPEHRAFTPANKVLCNVNTSLFILIFWGREKVFFGHKKNILLGVGKQTIYLEKIVVFPGENKLFTRRKQTIYLRKIVVFLLPKTDFWGIPNFSCKKIHAKIVHRAFTLRYTELFPSGAQSFLPPVHRASFWQPLQPWFVKETAFFFAKAQNLRIRLVPNSWDSYAGFLWHRAPPNDAELLPVHRAFSLGAQSFVLASKYP